VLRAREAQAAAPAIPILVEPHSDQEDDSDDPAASGRTRERTASDTRASKARAERDVWAESDPLSDSGVRHLRVEALDGQTGRWKRIRLRGSAANES
jgi:hypothetical protein